MGVVPPVGDGRWCRGEELAEERWRLMRADNHPVGNPKRKV
jgi:hypothetical protein